MSFGGRFGVDNCLSVNGGIGPGTGLTSATCNGGASEYFVLAGSGQIHPPRRVGRQLQVHLAGCNHTARQTWVPIGSSVGVDSNEHPDSSIANECLDVWGNGGSGSNVDDTNCNGSDAQGFTFDASHQIMHRGTYLTTSYLYGQPVMMESHPGGPYQQFQMVRLPSGGGLTFNGAALPNSCLDVLGDDNTPSTLVDLAVCNGSNAQVWHPYVIGFPQVYSPSLADQLGHPTPKP
jgi:hypothetical protein